MPLTAELGAAHFYRTAHVRAKIVVGFEPVARIYHERFAYTQFKRFHLANRELIRLTDKYFLRIHTSILRTSIDFDFYFFIFDERIVVPELIIHFSGWHFSFRQQ